ncbi:hypothetical protein IMG5_127670, partial [Ichthyophthirius multifiliis]
MKNESAIVISNFQISQSILQQQEINVPQSKIGLQKNSDEKYLNDTSHLTSDDDSYIQLIQDFKETQYTKIVHLCAKVKIALANFYFESDDIQKAISYTENAIILLQFEYRLNLCDKAPNATLSNKSYAIQVKCVKTIIMCLINLAKFYEEQNKYKQVLEACKLAEFFANKYLQKIDSIKKHVARICMEIGKRYTQFLEEQGEFEYICQKVLWKELLLIKNRQQEEEKYKKQTENNTSQFFSQILYDKFHTKDLNKMQYITVSQRQNINLLKNIQKKPLKVQQTKNINKLQTIEGIIYIIIKNIYIYIKKDQEENSQIMHQPIKQNQNIIQEDNKIFGKKDSQTNFQSMITKNNEKLTTQLSISNDSYKTASDLSFIGLDASFFNKDSSLDDEKFDSSFKSSKENSIQLDVKRPENEYKTNLSIKQKNNINNNQQKNITNLQQETFSKILYSNDFYLPYQNKNVPKKQEKSLIEQRIEKFTKILKKPRNAQEFQVQKKYIYMRQFIKKINIKKVKYLDEFMRKITDVKVNKENINCMDEVMKKCKNVIKRCDKDKKVIDFVNKMVTQKKFNDLNSNIKDNYNQMYLEQNLEFYNNIQFIQLKNNLKEQIHFIKVQKKQRNVNLAINK